MFSSNAPPHRNVHNVESLLLYAPHRSAFSIFWGVLEGALLWGAKECRQLLYIRKPRIERLSNVRGIMSISFAFKVDLCPILRRCVFLQTDRGVGIDATHVGHRLIIFFLPHRLGSLPQQVAQGGVLEMFAKVSFEMFDAIPMRTFGEDRGDTFQQALLAV